MYRSVTRIRLVIALIGSLVLGNSVDAGEPTVLVRYGTTFGECLAYCTTVIEVSATRVAYTADGFAPGVKRTPVSGQLVLSKQQQSALQRLLSETSAKGLPERIGNPDADDSGAEWIELNGSDHPKRITWEYGKAPAQLKQVTEWLGVLLKRIRLPQRNEA
jgi:hypothetical protein